MNSDKYFGKPEGWEPPTENPDRIITNAEWQKMSTSEQQVEWNKAGNAFKDRYEGALIELMNKPSALDHQEGGNHYKVMPIQPIEYAQKNRLNACEFNVVKYVTRHGSKGGKADLLKAKHCIDLLIEMEYQHDKS